MTSHITSTYHSIPHHHVTVCALIPYAHTQQYVSTRLDLDMHGHAGHIPRHYAIVLVPPPSSYFYCPST